MAPERPVPVRSQAAIALVKHIQRYGRFVTGPQADAIANAAATVEDADLQPGLLAAQGVLKTDLKATGDRLKAYTPKAVEPAKDEAPPPKEKEEPKEEQAGREEGVRQTPPLFRGAARSAPERGRAGPPLLRGRIASSRGPARLAHSRPGNEPGLPDGPCPARTVWQPYRNETH